MAKPILVSFLLVLLLFISYSFVSSQNDGKDGSSWSGQEQVRVGLVLDLGSMEGKMVLTSVSEALSDFYSINSNYKTKVSLSVRNSRGEPLLALASAIDLLQTQKVEAILGGNLLLETKLLAEIGDKARVPVISLNSPVSSLLSKYNHLIQATHDSVSEAKGIAAFINGFDLDNVTLVYEDDDDWREYMPFWVDQFHENAVRIQSKDGFTVSSGDDFILDRLQKMKDSGASVFVVHLSKVIATRFFSCVGKLGMMSDGFAWILTTKSMNSFFHDDDFANEAMEGVIGFKPYIPTSKELHNFTLRWRRSLPIEEEAEITRLGVSSLLAHDIAWVLAKAVEVARLPNVSSTLLEVITESSFKGLRGEFKLDDKMLLLDKFEIVNIMGSGERRIGFWNSNGSFSNRRHLTSTHNNLETIIWPGGSSQSPKGRNLEKSKRKLLRVLVTSSNRFPRLMNVETDQVTKVTNAQGFCIDVFLASINPFNYDVEYIPWRGGTDYDQLAYTLYSQKDKYDAAVGDITITSNRSMYVDFTVPFTEMGLGIVAAKERSMWVFFQPLKPGLWMTSATFFILTGITVWLIERSENPEFQGSWSNQIGIVFWFGFSTLVYAHRERLRQNLSRFVVTVWLFAVLILTASYNATLTSMMTVQQIRFNSNEDYVGHLSGSFIANAALTNSSLRAMRHLGLNSSDDYAKALMNRTVSVVVDELPYLKVLLGENPAHFLMVKTQCTTNGFGFMFQKGSDLVPNVSREILKLRTNEILNNMEKRWFENQLPHTTDDTSNPVTLYRFRGLFMITGVSFAFALVLHLSLWLQNKWKVLVDLAKIFISRRLMHFRILFARIVHPSPLSDPIGENTVQMAQSN